MVSEVTTLDDLMIDVAGAKVRVLRGGSRDLPVALFLHGGLPGISPYCSGAHIWGDAPALFGENRHVVVPDMPGSGGTVPTESPSVPSLARHVASLLTALDLESVDVVGHELGGLIGMTLALDQPARVRSLSVVASPMAAPTADGLDNIVLCAPPEPLWGRESQAWVFERLSYSHTHVTPGLLDACVAAARGPAHRRSAEMVAQSQNFLVPSLTKSRHQLWNACRNQGVPVPTQIVWASHDPTTSREQAFILFKTIAAKQSATQMHVINRSGSFPFREQPAAFCHVISAFQAGVAAEIAAN
jgi:2-hydroxy-6-oxonona-2,4-dienedioate hydrolase